jgi:hypothetical protein
MLFCLNANYAMISPNVIYDNPIMTKTVLRIATRKSPLALWQAEHVRLLLLQHWPELRI